MPKVRIIKNYKEYRIGEVYEVTPNIAFGLIDKGVARVDKMMTKENYRTQRGNSK